MIKFKNCRNFKPDPTVLPHKTSLTEFKYFIKKKNLTNTYWHNDIKQVSEADQIDIARNYKQAEHDWQICTLLG